MNFGDKGADVQEMQTALEDQGYQLPKYGADGDFGNETKAALEAFAADEGLPMGDPVPEETLNALIAGRGAGWDMPDGKPDLTIPDLTLPTKVIDMRGEQTDPPAMARKFKRAGGKVVRRDPEQVTGITIHQTAVKYSVRDYQIQAAGGDRELALARRALNVACHCMAFHDGFVVWTNPLDWYVYHGNGFNAFELGIEIDGNYPGVKGGETWNGKPSTVVTSHVIEAARKGIELLTIEGRKMGMPIEYIHAHRQSSATRRSDPGQELWQKVVLEYAVPHLGLKTEPARVLQGRNGNGRPIPREWDQEGVGSY